MKTADLYQFIENPALLSVETLPGLKQMVDEYPYFHIAKMLYLKNLSLVDDTRFAAELKNMAVYIPDRKKLFTLIEGERYGLQLRMEEDKSQEPDNTFSLIDAFLATREEDNLSGTETSLLFQPSVSSDYIYWSLTKEKETKEKEPEIKLQHHELIDSFIESEEQRAPGSGLLKQGDTTSFDAPVNFAEQEDDQPKSLDDSYFTETLAHIYVKQKRYEKALQIIKNLNLKYPEKNVYFADQIRFLEKLIINTKK